MVKVLKRLITPAIIIVFLGVLLYMGSDAQKNFDYSDQLPQTPTSIFLGFKAEEGMSAEQMAKAEEQLGFLTDANGFTYNRPATLQSGDVLDLKAVIQPTGLENYTLDWSVKDGSGVVTVDENGRVTAVSSGTATVVASSDITASSIQVTVE